MPAGDREEAPIAQFLLDQKVMQVAPGCTSHDDLLLHQLVAYRPAMCAFEDVIVWLDAVTCGVANDALNVVTHLFGRDVVGDGEAQEAWCDHREELDRTQVDELEPRIGLVDMVDDQIE